MQIVFNKIIKLNKILIFKKNKVQKKRKRNKILLIKKVHQNEIKIKI